MKKFLPILLVAGALLTGCGDEKEKETVLEQVESDTRLTGLYLEHVDKKHVSFQSEEGERVITVPEGWKVFFEELESGDTITIEYEKNEYNEMVVKKATSLKAGNKNEQNPEGKEEDSSEDTLEPGEVKSAQGYTMNVLDSYEFYEEQGIDYLRQKGTENKVQIEKIPSDTNIQEERWHAAADLQTIGQLIEMTNGQNLYDALERAEFVFTASNDKVQRTFVVKWIEGRLYRFVFHFDQSISGEEKGKIYTMIGSLK